MGVARYVCSKNPGRPNCGKVTAKAEPLDEFIVGAWLSAASNPAILHTKTITGDAADASRELARIEEKMAQLARDQADDLITRREWLAQRDVLNARREQAVEQLSRLRSAPTLKGIVGSTREDLARRLEAAPLDRKRALVSALIAHVIVKPCTTIGRREFDPSRIEIEWRA
jgi:hypothetical protein